MFVQSNLYYARKTAVAVKFIEKTQKNLVFGRKKEGEWFLRGGIWDF